MRNSGKKFVPISEIVGRFILFPLSFAEERKRERRERVAQERREQVAREDALLRQQELDDEIRRETAQKEIEARTALAEKKSKVDRDSILFQVRLLYDRHAGEIRSSFPVERFEQYFEDYFPEDLEISVLSARAKQLEEMILSFFVEEESPARTTTLSDIDAEYERRKREIQASSQDDDTKDSLMARLEKWRAKAMREQTTY